MEVSADRYWSCPSGRPPSPSDEMMPCSQYACILLGAMQPTPGASSCFWLILLAFLQGTLLHSIHFRRKKAEACPI